MSPLIKTESLSITRQGKDILKDISLAVGQRDFITIVGPNGAGKSMLLKALIGICKIDKGKISRKTHLRAGYVPQNFVVDQALPISVKRFLLLRKKVDRLNFQRVIEETNITPVLDKPLCVLSGGELQGVLMARSLLDDPELLVLDEPAQNLDISGQLAFYRLLDRIYNERKLSILMVSHDLHMVMASTKQVICLFRHICCSGEPHVVTKDPEFISLFGKDMANMMATYQHSHNHTHKCNHHA